jgi:hypothetical protein
MSQKKSARGELADLLQSTVEIDLADHLPLPEMRDRLTRHILLTDLVVGLGDTLPASLSSLKVATSPGPRAACKELARNWRMRRDLRDSYVTASHSVEENSHLRQIEFNSGAITEVETFACLERALLRNVEEALEGGVTPELLDLAATRQSHFWSEVTPTIRPTGRSSPPSPGCSSKPIGSPRRSRMPPKRSLNSSTPTPRVNPPGAS